MTVNHLYPTPVYSSVVDDYQVVNYHIDKIIDKVHFNMKEKWGATHYLSTDFSSKSNVIKEFGLHKLRKEIDNHLMKYCSELNFGMRNYRLESWLSKFEKGNYAHVHAHGEADISGGYYYKTNGMDGDFFFESPNPFLETTRCFTMSSLSHRWVYKPHPGKILLFPGWLKHGVTTNTTDNSRISLAFNIYFKDV